MTPAEDVQTLARETLAAFSQFVAAPWYRRLWWAVGGRADSPRLERARAAYYALNQRLTPDARGKPGAPWQKRRG